MTTKIAISLPDELVDDAREAVRAGRAASVSAYIANALVARKREHTLESLVADLKAEFGEPSPEDDAWAAEVLGL